MKADDIYGIPNDDIEATRLAIEGIIGVKLKSRESLYHGGDYYRWSGEGDESIILKRNIDLIDDELVEPEHSEMKLVLLVEGSKRYTVLEHLLISRLEGVQLLKRDIW